MHIRDDISADSAFVGNGRGVGAFSRDTRSRCRRSRACLVAISVCLAAAFLFAGTCLFPGRSQAREAGKRIVVSIDDQFAYFLEDGFLVKSHIVSTGKDKTPTPLGRFNIYAHQYAVASGSVVQCYTMFFYSNLGFHSVLYNPSAGSWSGVSALGSKASHGCARQTLDDSRWAYYWAPDGTPIDMIQEHFQAPPPKPLPAVGGSGAPGATRAEKQWYFAEGSCRPGFDPYLCMQNPGAAEAQVRIEFMLGDGTQSSMELAVAPGARHTVRVKDHLGEGDDPAHGFSCKVESRGAGIAVERPTYFNYRRY